MSKFATYSGAAAIMMLTAGAAFAAPCAVGTTTNNEGKATSGDKSSMVDGASAAKISPGAKAETPGTVGALNNVGAGTKPADGEQKPAVGHARIQDLKVEWDAWRAEAERSALRGSDQSRYR